MSANRAVPWLEMRGFPLQPRADLLVSASFATMCEGDGTGQRDDGASLRGAVRAAWEELIAALCLGQAGSVAGRCELAAYTELQGPADVSGGEEQGVVSRREADGCV
jgi:hypothetical protein